MHKLLSQTLALTENFQIKLSFSLHQNMNEAESQKIAYIGHFWITLRCSQTELSSLGLELKNLLNQYRDLKNLFVSIVV